MPTNNAAWINAKYAQLEVGPAPYTPPADDRIVIRGRAVAIDPLEWIIQVAGGFAYRWLKYPTVLGSDVAGEVVEVGRAVTRLRVGDRVLGHAVGTDKDSNSAAEGTFQEYAVVLDRMASPIPDSMPFTDAAVLPLAFRPPPARCSRKICSGCVTSPPMPHRHPEGHGHPAQRRLGGQGRRHPALAALSP